MPSVAAHARIDTMLVRYMDLFSYRVESTVRRGGTNTWRAVSRYHYLTDDEIKESLQTNAKLSRAVCLDTKTELLAISIPANSRYHNTDAFQNIRNQLKDSGIYTAPYKFEDHWYLFIFLNEKVSLNEYGAFLSSWLNSLGYQLEPETLQVTSSGTPIPLPLQNGFAWLDEYAVTSERRDQLSFDKALEKFMSDAEFLAISPTLLEQLPSHMLELKPPADPRTSKELLQTAQFNLAPELGSAIKAFHASSSAEDPHTQPVRNTHSSIDPIPQPEHTNALEELESPLLNDSVHLELQPLPLFPGPERDLALAEDAQRIPGPSRDDPTVPDISFEETNTSSELVEDIQLPLFAEFPVAPQTALRLPQQESDQEEKSLKNKRPPPNSGDKYPQLQLFAFTHSGPAPPAMVSAHSKKAKHKSKRRAKPKKQKTRFKPKLKEKLKRRAIEKAPARSPPDTG